MNAARIKIDLTGSRPKLDLCEYEFQVADPYLYIVNDADAGRHPLYIGETGKSKTYTAPERIRLHFKSTKSSTLNRIYKNMSAFGFAVPKNIDGFLFKLSDEFRGNDGTVNRQSLEAWVIHLTCHRLRIQDDRFAVSKYSRALKNYEHLAETIIESYRSYA